MVTKKLKTWRASPATLAQLDTLKQHYGTEASAIETAIDRLHTAATQPPVTIKHGKLTITVDNVDQARAILGLLDSPLTEEETA